MVPGITLGFTRYLRPGYDFRIDMNYTPLLQDPMNIEAILSSRIAFNYGLVIKLNNGIFLKESVRFAPFFLMGAGGSYHAGKPDAFSPFRLGMDVRLFGPNHLRFQAGRNVSWNRSPQPWHISVMYVWKFQVPKPVLPLDQPTTENVIAQVIDPDSDEDGIPDEEDICPYEAGLIQDDGCPVDTPKDTAVTQPDTLMVAADSLVPVPQADSTSEPVLPPTASDTTDARFVAESDPAPETDANFLEEEPETPCGTIDFPVIAFAANQSTLSQANKELLIPIAEQLKACPRLTLRLEGHANEKRDEDGNLVLSIKRAYNIKYYLVYEHHISQQRIISGGAGSNASDQFIRTVSFDWSS